MALRSYVVAALAVVGVATSLPSVAQIAAAPTPVSAKVPAFPGWHNGRPVVYLATDASDKGAAGLFGANYVPQLANALTSNPKSFDDIYVVTNFTQANIIPSAPQPLGPKNSNQAYTPLWQVSNVTWVDGVTRHTLRSEREVLNAIAKQQMTIVKTTIVVNCSVVETPSGTLPNTVVNYK